MKKRGFWKWLILFIAIAFGIHQAYSYFYTPVKTENAEYYVADEGIKAHAVIVRQETVVTSDAGGSHHFLIQNGNRVSKGGVLANVYGNDTDSLTVSRLESLNESIKDMEELTGYNDTAAADITLINQEVTDSVNRFIGNCSGGNFTNAYSCENDLLFAINRKLFLTGETVDFGNRLNQLKSEKSDLSKSLPTPIRTVKADISGYFVSTVDGYENLLSVNNLDELTPERIEKLKPETPAQNAIGKIVSDYDWCLAANVSISQASKYVVGDELLVKTKVRNNAELSVEVEKINISKTSDKATVIMSCQEMNSELASLRSADIDIISKEYKGLKLSKTALRVVDGKTGVYVVFGLSLKFVPVDVIYSTDEFIICKQEKVENSTVLRLYDEVVVKGKNRYDGKIIN
ncbi:MAG: hypothetical protein MJ080_01360 [Clostridia bacterium]|nr:hypothetical protein [Clostridia bacterium]